MDKESNYNDIIRGIKCDVTNCAYHTAGDQCGAGQIKVNQSTCDCKQDCDTKCATFEAKF